MILYRFVSKTEITEWLVKCYDKQISGKGIEREMRERERKRGRQGRGEERIKRL